MAMHLPATVPTARPVPAQIGFSAAISPCEKGGKLQMVLHMLSKMLSKLCRMRSVSMPGSARVRQAVNGQKALRSFKEMPPAKAMLDEISFSAAVAACEKRGESQMASYVLSEMLSVKVCPNMMSFNAGISVCGAARFWCILLRLYIQLVSGDLSPSHETYVQGPAISVCAQTVGFLPFKQALKGQAWSDTLRFNNGQKPYLFGGIFGEANLGTFVTEQVCRHRCSTWWMTAGPHAAILVCCKSTWEKKSIRRACAHSF